MLGNVPGSIRLARLARLDINVHFSWIVIFFVVVTDLSESIYPDQFPQWSREKTFVVSAVSASLFFSSVVAHELAHSLVARRFHMTVSSITLFMLGGVASLTREPPSARAELFMAAAGPLTSIVIGIAGVVIAFAADAAASTDPSATWLQVVSAVAGYVGPINMVVAVFNLVPGFPLDGGRVLRAAIWGITKDRLRATRIASRGGQIIRDLVHPMNLRAIPVVSGDRLVGLITIGDLRKIDQDRWATTPVEQVMTPGSELPTVSPGDALGTALERFAATDLPLLPVVKDGRLVGVLYREAVIGYVRMQEMVAPQGRR